MHRLPCDCIRNGFVREAVSILTANIFQRSDTIIFALFAFLSSTQKNCLEVTVDFK